MNRFSVKSATSPSLPPTVDIKFIPLKLHSSQTTGSLPENMQLQKRRGQPYQALLPPPIRTLSVLLHLTVHENVLE